MAANPGGARVWFITGCSSEFGRELAGAVLRRGGRAVLAGADPAGLVDLVASYPTAARALPLEGGDESQIADAVAIAEGAFGGIDVLVNIAESSANSLAVIRAALPGMCARGAGHVIDIGATADGFVDALGRELAPLGVRIAAVEPDIESVVRLVEAPGPSFKPVDRADPERLRQILARLRATDEPQDTAPIGANDAVPVALEELRSRGRAAE
jgi:NAD(P)-dependent dehydrogenase (short-subunit alcohol dehydrogenase family)